MQTTKKTLILTSALGTAGMATFTRVGNSVNFSISVFRQGGYRLVLKGDKLQEFEILAPRASFILSNFDIENVGVGIYVDGKLFCKGGFYEEIENEECESNASDESEESAGEKEQEEESVTYMDEAVAIENYYPSDIKVVSENDKSVAVLLSAKIGEYIENATEGLFNYKIRRKKEEKPQNQVKHSKISVFAKKPFDQDEVASTVFPIESVEFSRKAFYYEQIKDRVDALFKMGEIETNLTKLMPDARWVKIEYSPSLFYVVGVVGREGNVPQYICYGVPSDYSHPIVSLGKEARWVPIDVRDPQGKGYWVLFQSAKSGESIKID